MNEDLSMFEKKIISAILQTQKDTEMRERLYKQCEVATVKERTLTGVGFYTDIVINEKSLSLKSNKKMKLSRVHANIEGLKHGAGFILYIEDGVITILEGYSYDEQWPDNPKISELFVLQEDGTLGKLKK